MEEKIVIFAAGSPSAYPLEYYNPETKSFEGVIPELYKGFSSESKFEIVYYMADGSDRREELLKNTQVDLVSSYPGEEGYEDCERLTVLSAEEADGLSEYTVYLTKAAPEDFKEELYEYISGVGQERVSGLLIEASREVPRDNTPVIVAVAIAVAAAVIITVLSVLLHRYRKRLRKALEDKEKDSVTGLGNIDYLKRYAKQFINDKNRPLYQLMYMYVDIDHIRRVGGSQEADDFMRHCAVTLQDYTSDSDILSRVSDHGFVIMKLSLDSGKAGDWLSEMLDRVRAYSKTYSKPYDTEMHVGIFPMKKDSKNLDEAVFSASQAAIYASDMNQEYCFCSDEMLSALVRDKQLQAGIERGFENKEFELYIQFYVDCDTESIVGGEALSRWNHPQRGLLAPAVFVPLMEREGMISRLDYYCLEKVCFFLEGLSAKGVKSFFVSCNFSRETFASLDFAQRAGAIIRRFSFPKELLILEITESQSVRNVSQIRKNILELKKLGISMMLDDFGEGFTSFYDLQKYPINGIKLDKNLVDHIMTQSGATILRVMIQVGHELGMTILAEGVESREQVEALKQMNCDVIQGFSFYRPIPEWEAENILTQR